MTDETAYDEIDNALQSAADEEAGNDQTPAVLEFYLRRAEIPVKLRDPETGAVHEYVLRELDGMARDLWLNTVNGRSQVNPDGKSARIKDFKGFQATLISMSLFDAATDKPVAVAVIQKWPSRVQTGLFEQAQKLSSLDDKAAERAKND